MSERLPILRLPLVALEKVIKDVDPIDVFHLSLCSSRCHEAVRMAKPKKNVFKIYWTLAPNSNEIFLAPKLQIDILERPRAVPKKKKLGIPMSFGNGAFSGHHALLHVSSEPLRIEFNVKNSKARESLLKLLITHLRSLFNCDCYQLNYEAAPVDPELLTLLLPIKTLNLKYPQSFCNKTFPFVGLEAGQIENLRLQKHGGPRDAFTELPPIGRMDLGRAPWLSFRHISNLNFLALRVEEPNLTSRDINQILLKWSSGGHDRLESLIITQRFIDDPYLRLLSWTRDEILRGLNEVERWGEHDRVIQRADGLRARVQCTEEGVSMYVFHQRLSRNKFLDWHRWRMSGGEQDFYNYVRS